MRGFLIRRAYFALLSLIAATMIVFGLSRVYGDPLLVYTQEGGGYGLSEEQKEEISRYLGLDKPLIVQYLVWIGNSIRGDFGKTLLDRAPVYGLIKGKLGATVQLAIAAWAFAVVTGVPLGVLSATRRGGALDYLGRTFALFGQALPQFWIAIMAIVIFAVYLDWLPASGRALPGDDFWKQVRHFILPTVTLGWLGSATYLRLVRSSMLEVLDSEYVKLARAKGTPAWKVIWKHAFRNALISPITYSSLFLASFITGATVVELVFAWPGIGRLALTAVQNNDFALLTGIVLFFAVAYIFFNFVADVLYGLIDPRIRYD
ncbi:MAG: ABC transporter permease [Dehalococcoidia bacterium]|nr:ABC transporter permease [Dehalococcoidia bacterium]